MTTHDTATRAERHEAPTSPSDDAGTSTTSSQETGRARRSLSRREAFDIVRFMERLVTPAGAEHVVYAEGYDDARVASECGVPNVHAGHVKSLRLEFFGKLPEPVAKNPDLRIAQLEAAVEELRSALEAEKTIREDLERRITTIERETIPA